MTHQPLRVLDLTDDLAAMAGRLLVGTGADVIRIESSNSDRGGDADRLHWHSGKRVVQVSPERLDALVARLVVDADVVIESGSVASLRTPRLRDASPADWAHVAHVVVTPFGLTGPRANWLADDAVASAAGGMAWLGGDPDSAPTPPPREQATQLAGTHAAIAALLAVIARRRTRTGQFAEVSVQEAVAATLETGAISWIHAETVPGRTSGVYAHVAHRVFPTSDGYVAGGYSGSNRMWDDLLAWMVEEGEAEDLAEEIWQDPVHRWQQRPHVDAVVAAFSKRRTTETMARAGRERSLPWAAVATPADLLDNPQLAHRRFLVEIETANGKVPDVGFPYESPAMPRPVHLPAPAEVGTDVAWRPQPGDATARVAMNRRDDEPQGALTGVRVLDLTWVLAGPYVTRTLGDHGAEIIKVESRHRQDPTRFSPGMRLRPDAGPDDSGYFLNFNRNKRSLALNLRSEQGPELLRQLAAEVDVIVENFSPGTLAKWGLDWESLRRLNPGVVLVSMAGVGSDGPWRKAVTFADTLAAMSGLTHETGGEAGPPQGLTFGLGDMVAANAATLATLEHLIRGEGGHVDLSQLEAMSAHLGTALIETVLPSQRAEYDDSQRLVGPLTLRTAGSDRWLTVGITPAKQFTEAVTAWGGQRLDDPVATLRGLAETSDADTLADQLQQRGVAAYAVRDGRDLVTCDPQLAARGFYPVQKHPLAGDVQVEGVVAHLTATPARLTMPAPLLGQHTDELLDEILGLDPEHVRHLHQQGVLE